MNGETEELRGSENNGGLTSKWGEGPMMGMAAGHVENQKNNNII